MLNDNPETDLFPGDQEPCGDVRVCTMATETGFIRQEMQIWP